MSVQDILTQYASHHTVAIIISLVYVIILWQWKKHLPELYDLAETVIVIIWTLYTMLIYAPLIPVQYWGIIAVGLSISAFPIVIYSLITKGRQLRRLFRGIERNGEN